MKNYIDLNGRAGQIKIATDADGRLQVLLVPGLSTIRCKIENLKPMSLRSVLTAFKANVAFEGTKIVIGGCTQGTRPPLVKVTKIGVGQIRMVTIGGDFESPFKAYRLCKVIVNKMESGAIPCTKDTSRS